MRQVRAIQERPAVVDGEVISRAATSPAPTSRVPSWYGVIGCGDWIVIECKLYLFENLLDARSIKRPNGDIYRRARVINARSWRFRRSLQLLSEVRTLAVASLEMRRPFRIYHKMQDAALAEDSWPECGE